MKKAFSLIEILIILFVVTAVIFTVVPFSMSNMKQVKLVAEWKNYINQVDYSYETLLEYQKNHKISQKASIEMLMDYLDAKPVSFDSEVIKKYQYKNMNSKFYQKIDSLRLDEFFVDIKNRIIGIKYKSFICTETTPCVMVIVDLNGNQKPNIVGKDIFVYEVYKDKIRPLGDKENYSTIKDDCSILGTGFYCSKFYLISSNFR